MTEKLRNILMDLIFIQSGGTTFDWQKAFNLIFQLLDERPNAVNLHTLMSRNNIHTIKLKHKRGSYFKRPLSVVNCIGKLTKRSLQRFSYCIPYNAKACLNKLLRLGKISAISKKF